MKPQSKKKRLMIKQFSLLLVFVIAIIITIYCTSSNMVIINTSTVAFIFLIIVVLSSFFCNLIIGIMISIIAALCFNYFYLSPIGTFNIYAFADWISLFTFLFTSIFISTITHSSMNKRKDLNKIRLQNKMLNIFCSWLLLQIDDTLTLTIITEELVKLFKFDYCSINIITSDNINNLIGQSINESFKYPGKTIIKQDHAVDLTDTIDEYDLDVVHIKIENKIFNIIFAYKTYAIDIDFLTNLSYVIFFRINRCAKFKFENQ